MSWIRLSQEEERGVRNVGTCVFQLERLLILLLIFAYDKSYLCELASVMAFATTFLAASFMLLCPESRDVGPSRLGGMWLFLLDRLTFYLASHYANTLEVKRDDLAFVWSLAVALAVLVHTIYVLESIHKLFTITQSQTISSSYPQDSHITEPSQMSTEEVDQKSDETIDCPNEIDSLRGQLNWKLDEIWEFLEVVKESIQEEVESTIEKIKQETEALIGEVLEKLDKIWKDEENMLEKVEYTFKKIRQENEALREELKQKLEEIWEDEANIIRQVESTADKIDQVTEVWGSLEEAEENEEHIGEEVRSTVATIIQGTEALKEEMDSKINQMWGFLEKFNVDLENIGEKVNSVVDEINQTSLVPQETGEISCEEPNDEEEELDQRSGNSYSAGLEGQEGEVDWDTLEDWYVSGRLREDEENIEEEEVKSKGGEFYQRYVLLQETGEIRSVEDETENVEERLSWAEEKAEILAELRAAKASANFYKACMRNMAID